MLLSTALKLIQALGHWYHGALPSTSPAGLSTQEGGEGGGGVLGGSGGGTMVNRLLVGA